VIVVAVWLTTPTFLGTEGGSKIGKGRILCAWQNLMNVIIIIIVPVISGSKFRGLGWEAGGYLRLSAGFIIEVGYKLCQGLLKKT
jgi:hypothetical protein